MKKERKNLQQTLSFLLLAVTLGAVLYIGLKGNDMHELSAALKKISLPYLLLLLMCWALYLAFDTLAIHHFLHTQGHRIRFRESLHSAMTGIYYCNITPGASGGQPMQMYCLSKYGVPIGISGSGMAVKFVVFQSVLLVFGALLWFAQWDFVSAHADGSRWFILLGYIANFFTIGMVMLMAISQKAVRWVIERCIRIGVKLHLCKNPDASREKWENHCAGFLGSVKLLMRRPLDLLVQCLIALGQLLTLMLVIVVIYHALDLNDLSVIRLITLGVLLYIGASYVPLPGASGAQEGGFAMLFRHVFPDANLFVALLIWRFTTYYLSVLAGAVMTTVEHATVLRRAKKESVAE